MNVQENFLARFRFYAFSPSSLKASIENAHTKACVCAQKVRGKREALSYVKICIHSSTWRIVLWMKVSLTSARSLLPDSFVGTRRLFVAMMVAIS